MSANTARGGSATPPGLVRLVVRMLLLALGAGLALGILLALAGVGAAGDGPALVLSLLPAVATIGPAMGVPPFLFALLGLAIVIRPPRALRQEQTAVAIGAALGSFASPALFYPASVWLGLAIAAVLGVTLAISFALLLARMWDPTPRAPRDPGA